LILSCVVAMTKSHPYFRFDRFESVETDMILNCSE